MSALHENKVTMHKKRIKDIQFFCAPDTWVQYVVMYFTRIDWIGHESQIRDNEAIVSYCSRICFPRSGETVQTAGQRE